MRRRARWLGIGVAALLVAGCGGGSTGQTEQDLASMDASIREARQRSWSNDADAAPPQMVVPLASIPILKTVLKPSDAYTIDPEVRVEGYYYRFVVRAPHGVYDVVSVRRLLKLTHEIEVLEHFRKTNDANHVWEGVGQSIAGVGKGLGKIVLHPGQSVKTVGLSVGRLTRATGRLLTRPFRDPAPVLASDGTDRALAGKGPAGGERRAVANELGLDVYSDNPNVMILINEIARKRLAGKLPVGAGVFALPGGIVFTLSMSPEGLDDATENLIRDTAPGAEMRRELAKRYADAFGLTYDGALQTLLENPNFTPREQAYLCHHLTTMKGVKDIQAALAFLADTPTPERADIVSAQVELLALLHQRVRPLQTFVPVHNTLGGLSRAGTLCLVISIDTVRYWPDVRASLDRTLRAAQTHKAKKMEIWSTGDIDAESVALAHKLGVGVAQNILAHPLFRARRSGNVPLRPAPKADTPPPPAEDDDAPVTLRPEPDGAEAPPPRPELGLDDAAVTPAPSEPDPPAPPPAAEADAVQPRRLVPVPTLPKQPAASNKDDRNKAPKALDPSYHSPIPGF